MYFNRTQVAPYGMIAQDFRELDAAETLRTTWANERLILMQSVQGHAHEGHRAFSGRRYPNTTMDDISRALRIDPVVVRADRQKLIDEISAYADRVMAGNDSCQLANEHGAPLLGSSMFHHIEVSGNDVLKGLCLGGLRDDAGVRFEMESRYGITIGGGKCYLVDTKVMEQMELNGDILAHSAHEDMLDYYRDKGLIAGECGPDTGDLEYMYIRYRRGQGASDDAAIIAAGLIHGFGVAVGVFLADAIDTLEKHVPSFSDQDNELARKIMAKCPDLGLSDGDIRHLAYLCATPDEAPIQAPDSSLRLLMDIDREADCTAIESHLLYVQGKKYPELRIGHEGTRNAEFYDYVRDRVDRSPGVL
jgi:hypothetical protein